MRAAHAAGRPRPPSLSCPGRPRACAARHVPDLATHLFHWELARRQLAGEVGEGALLLLVAAAAAVAAVVLMVEVTMDPRARKLPRATAVLARAVRPPARQRPHLRLRPAAVLGIRCGQRGPLSSVWQRQPRATWQAQPAARTSRNSGDAPPRGMGHSQVVAQRAAQRVEGLARTAAVQALLPACPAQAPRLPSRRSRHSRPLFGGAEGRAALFVAATTRTG